MLQELFRHFPCPFLRIWFPDFPIFVINDTFVESSITGKFEINRNMKRILLTIGLLLPLVMVAQERETVWPRGRPCKTLADVYYNELRKTFKSIVERPVLFDREYTEIKAGIYGRKCKKHIVFYKLENTDNIEIIRILHEKMDIGRRL